MKTVKKINSNNDLLSLSNNAYKYRNTPVRSITGQFAGGSFSAGVSYAPIFNTSSLIGDQSLIIGANKFIAPEDGTYVLTVHNMFIDGGKNVHTFIQHFDRSNNRKAVIEAPPFPADQALLQPTVGSFQMQAGDIVFFTLLSDTGGASSGNTGVGTFCFSQMEKQIPDVYHTAFSNMVPDYSTAESVASGTGNTVSYTAQESAFYTFGATTVSGAVGNGIRVAIRVTPYNSTTQIDIQRSTYIVFTGQTIAYIFNTVYLHKGDSMNLSKSGLDIAGWDISKILGAPISIIKPTVQALPAGIDFMAETQIGWYEVTSGNFKPKYSRRFPFANVAVGSTSAYNYTLGTITGGFTLLDAIGNYRVDGTPLIGNLLPINRFNNPAMTQQTVISFVRSNNDFLLSNLYSSGVTGQTISGEATAIYTKTADSTQTLAEIMSNQP
jgi:hypothetical protein